jgi:hypothetical protein
VSRHHVLNLPIHNKIKKITKRAPASKVERIVRKRDTSVTQTQTQTIDRLEHTSEVST